MTRANPKETVLAKKKFIKEQKSENTTKKNVILHDNKQVEVLDLTAAAKVFQIYPKN